MGDPGPKGLPRAADITHTGAINTHIVIELLTISVE